MMSSGKSKSEILSRFFNMAVERIVLLGMQENWQVSLMLQFLLSATFAVKYSSSKNQINDEYIIV